MRRFFILCLILISSAARADAPKTPRPELALQVGHTGGVSRVAMSPDGTMIASAEFDAGTVKIWDVRTGDLLRTFREPGISFTYGVKFSPDNSLLAVALSGGLKLWNTRSGVQGPIISGSLGGSSNESEFAFSPDGRWVAQNVYDYQKGPEVRLVDLHTGKVGQRILLDQTGKCSIQFSPDGKTLLGLRPADGLIRTWNVATGEQVTAVTVDSKGAGAPIISADGTLVSFARTSGNVSEVAVCDARTGKRLSTLKAKGMGFYSLAMSPDGQLLAAVTTERTLTLWNPRGGELLQTLSPPKPDALIGAAFAPDGRTLAAGSSNGSVQLYDITAPAKPRLARTLRGRGDFMVGVAFSPDGGTVFSEAISAQEDNPHLREWDAKTGALRRTVAPGHFSLHATALSPDGTLLARATGGFEEENTGSLQLLNAKTGAVIRGFPNAANVSSVAFINGGKTLAGGVIGKNVIRLWDVATGTVRQNVEVKTDFPDSQTFVCSSPDGNLLAVGESLSSVQVWNTRQEPLKEPLMTFARDKIPFVISALTFAPDSTTLALSTSNGTLLFNAKTGERIRALEQHGGYVFATAFSPDGRRLATAGDSTVKLWNPNTGRLLATLFNFPRDDARPGDAEDFLALTPEGYYAGSAASDRYVKFRLGDTLYPAESFQARYYRPDLVQKALAGEELPPVGEFKGPFPPVAKLSANVPDKFAGDTVSVTLAATDDSSVKNVAFFINGARVDAKPLTADSRPLTADSRALTADSKALTTDSRPLADSRTIPEAHKILRRYTATLPLPPGASSIKVQAIAFDDDGLQSPREEVLFSREATAAPQGKLIGLCVGVSQYQDARLNLKFAEADATALSEALGKKRGIYSTAQINALTDEKATAKEVKSQLDKLIANSTHADTVMISLSGHGWRDDTRNFYFATHEVNRNDVARTALPWKEITDRLTQLSQKSKRVIVLLDACHSGSAATNEELVKAILAANAGVLVFASSRGSEVSLENADWKHGAFTKALLEAIEGKAAPDEKRVTIIDFIAYVSRRVKTLTQDQQHPQVPFLQDFDTDATIVEK